MQCIYLIKEILLLTLNKIVSRETLEVVSKIIHHEYNLFLTEIHI